MSSSHRAGHLHGVTASALVWNTVMPALGLALILGASLVPALVLAAAAVLAIYAVLAGRPGGPRRRLVRAQR
jgi:hypothetical protein